MITNRSLIFIIEDDIPYGRMLQTYLRKKGLENVKLFHDEKHLLDNMEQKPEVLIADYHLNYLNGLKVIEEARKVSKTFYSVLLSGAVHRERHTNDISMVHIDKYIKKGENEMQQLFDVMDELMNPEYVRQFF